MARHLMAGWHKEEKRLKEKYIFIFLDYDGTLTPITARPDKALLPRKTKDLLADLSRSRFFKVAVISGRSLKDIKRKIGLPGIIYVGNHGLEIAGGGLHKEYKAPKGYLPVLKKLKARLLRRLSGMPGVIIEDKGLTLTVHYRMARRGARGIILKNISDALNFSELDKTLKIALGKKIFEIKPRDGFDKGKVAGWLLNQRVFPSGKRPARCIYIGDDITDEDAFLYLRGKALTVSVGKRSGSSAGYYLRDTSEVTMF
ncbi:MAG TPA: trehalose-phosphatase, partial [Candidatus Omnitrophota bacterium]|nr:trehalose-phosphatase [Candidatus Omnitrophota bacterium]